MKRACRQCGCTETTACLELDAEGYAHACYWPFPEDICSACVFKQQSDPLPFGESGDTRVRNVNTGRPLRFPALAGMVVRPRRPESKKARRQ